MLWCTELEHMHWEEQKWFIRKLGKKQLAMIGKKMKKIYGYV